MYPIKKRLKLWGFDISIENPAGSVRRWYDPHGKETGSTKMHYDYGYIRRTEGTDGDHVDVYIGPDTDSERVYVIDQMKKPATGSDWSHFDEQKVMLGFSSASDAKTAYGRQYDDPRFFGSMKEMSMAEFRDKVLDRANHGRKIAGRLKEAVSTNWITTHAIQGATRRGKNVGGLHKEIAQRARDYVRARDLPRTGLLRAGDTAESPLAGARTRLRGVLNRLKVIKPGEQEATAQDAYTWPWGNPSWRGQVQEKQWSPHGGTGADQGASWRNTKWWEDIEERHKRQQAVNDEVFREAAQRARDAYNQANKRWAEHKNRDWRSVVDQAMGPAQERVREVAKEVGDASAANSMLAQGEALSALGLGVGIFPSIHASTVSNRQLPKSDGANPRVYDPYRPLRTGAYVASDGLVGAGVGRMIDSFSRSGGRSTARGQLVGAGLGALAGLGLGMHTNRSLDKSQEGRWRRHQAKTSSLSDRIDDAGIGLIAAPYAAEVAGSGLSKFRNPKIKALGEGLRRVAGKESRFGHSSIRDLTGLAMVAPGVSHSVGRHLERGKQASAELQKLGESLHPEFEYLTEEEKLAFLGAAMRMGASALRSPATRRLLSEAGEAATKTPLFRSPATSRLISAAETVTPAISKLAPAARRAGAPFSSGMVRSAGPWQVSLPTSATDKLRGITHSKLAPRAQAARVPLTGSAASAGKIQLPQETLGKLAPKPKAKPLVSGRTLATAGLAGAGGVGLYGAYKGVQTVGNVVQNYGHGEPVAPSSYMGPGRLF